MAASMPASRVAPSTGLRTGGSLQPAGQAVCNARTAAHGIPDAPLAAGGRMQPGIAKATVAAAPPQPLPSVTRASSSTLSAEKTTVYYFVPRTKSLLARLQSSFNPYVGLDISQRSSMGAVVRHLAKKSPLLKASTLRLYPPDYKERNHPGWGRDATTTSIGSVCKQPRAAGGFDFFYGTPDSAAASSPTDRRRAPSARVAATKRAPAAVPASSGTTTSTSPHSAPPSALLAGAASPVLQEAVVIHDHRPPTPIAAQASAAAPQQQPQQAEAPPVHLQLSVSVGDTLRVAGKDGNWLGCYDAGGTFGYVPAACCARVLAMARCRQDYTPPAGKRGMSLVLLRTGDLVRVVRWDASSASVVIVPAPQRRAQFCIVPLDCLARVS